jgi:hypothetical protein
MPLSSSPFSSNLYNRPCTAFQHRVEQQRATSSLITQKRDCPLYGVHSRYNKTPCTIQFDNAQAISWFGFALDTLYNRLPAVVLNLKNDDDDDRQICLCACHEGV